jgi:uncharacterized membrane protein
MTDTNPNARLEAFCDGVFAIAMTLLIIEIKLPATPSIEDTAAFWLALWHIGPAVLAFVLSFVVIFITWVNHHAALRQVHGSSPAFIFANGLLLLTVVALPFPTALLGEHVLSDHAAPAVSLYNAVLVLQAAGWLLLSSTVLSDGLAKNEDSAAKMRVSRRYGLVALLIYSLCTVLALKFPLSVAIITVCVWSFWLVVAIKHQAPEAEVTPA